MVVAIGAAIANLIAALALREGLHLRQILRQSNQIRRSRRWDVIWNFHLIGGMHEAAHTSPR